MSEVEDDEALQHLLAFLDECFSQSDSNGSPDHPRSCGDADASLAKHSEQRKRSRLLAAKSRYRGRVKDEHFRLRNDALALEATLAQLQGLNSQAADASESHEQTLTKSSPSREVIQTQSSGTRDDFIREYKRRKRSEAVNRELKGLLALVRKTSCLTATAWGKMLSKENLAMLHNPHPSQSSLHHQVRANYVDSLAMCMDRLALDADWHFDRVGLSVSNSFTFRTLSVADAMLDSAFEIVMSSSLPCSKEQAASLIVLSFERDDEKDRPRQNKNMESVKTLKSVRFGLQQYQMEGFGTKRSIVEADRIRFFWSTLSFLPSAAMIFREDSIIALQSTSSSVSSPSCLLQVWYRVYAEPIATSNAEFQADLETKLLKESVLRSHCRTTGEFFQCVEKMLANEAFIS